MPAEQIHARDHDGKDDHLVSSDLFPVQQKQEQRRH